MMKRRSGLKKNLILVFSLFQMASVFAQKDNLPWVSLFNGRNLDGWEVIGDKGFATVQDGMIVTHRIKNTKQHTFVNTIKKYSDFILEVDFKMDLPGFSSGVLVRCIDSKLDPKTVSNVSLLGYQIKIDNTERNWTGGVFDDFGGTWKWMYDLTKNEPARAAFKKGEWNTFRIEAIGNNIKVWLNGVPATNLINDRYTKGSIALKIHSLGNDSKGEDNLIYYKNIRIITKKVAKYAQPMDLK
jgi:Domain of Unknown Function (DUF1080)